MVCVIFRFYAYISFLPSPALTAFRLNCWMFRNELKLLAWVVQEQSIWNDGARSVLFVEMKGLLEREKKIKSTLPPVADKPLNSFDAMYKYKAHEIKGLPSFQLLKLHVFVNFVWQRMRRYAKLFNFTVQDVSRTTFIKINNGFLIQIHTTANISFRLLCLLAWN